MARTPRGRPTRYAPYEELRRSLPAVMTKRPKYQNGIGIFRGQRGETAWIKIRLPHGGTWKGKAYPPDAYLEVKLGNLGSFDWAQLEEKRDELQGKADRNQPLEEAPSPTFAEWASDWLRRAQQRLKGYGTAKIHVESHLLPCFGTRRLADIRLNHVNDWIAGRLAVAKPATVLRELGTLNCILNDAVRAGAMEDNPGRHADTIRGVTGRQRFLTGEEIVSLLAEAEKVESWLADFIIWAVHSGMRKGEILCLRWSDIRSLPDGRCIALIQESKSDQPRSVTFTPSMAGVLRRQQDRRVQGDDRVFPISQMTLRRKWQAARIQANLGDVTVHDLRRTHSTYAAVAGVDLRTLAHRIGHSDLTMLQKHYAALVGDAATEAASKIQGAFDRFTQSPKSSSEEPLRIE